MAEAFARWLDRLLGPHGLVVFDSADPRPSRSPRIGVHPRARSRAGPPRWREAGEALRPRDTSRRWCRSRQRGALPSWRPAERRAAPIRSRGRQYRDRRAIVRGRRALIEEARQRPERFSPNVLLRPLVQDTLFPTICYVSGPERAGLSRPAGGGLRALRRADAAHVSPRHGHDRRLGVAALRRPLRSCRSTNSRSRTNRRSTACSRRSCRRPWNSRSHEAEEQVRQHMQRVIEAVPALDPTLSRRGAGPRSARWSTSCGRCTTRSSTPRSGATRRCAASSRAPRPSSSRSATRRSARSPVAFFLNRYGPALVDRLLDQLPLDLGQHWMLTI
jgi:hypothetical protein